jgi:hypothetical protein
MASLHRARENMSGDLMLPGIQSRQIRADRGTRPICSLFQEAAKEKEFGSAS